MAKYEFTYPTKADAEYVAANLKSSNRQEVLCAIGNHALEDITEGIAASRHVGCLKIDGRAAAVFGVVPDSVMSDAGVVWLLLTRETEEHKVFVARHTKKGLRAVLTHYSRVYNYVDVNNTEIIKWLEWLGAEISGPIPHGIHGAMHYYFEFKRKE